MTLALYEYDENTHVWKFMESGVTSSIDGSVTFHGSDNWPISTGKIYRVFEAVVPEGYADKDGTFKQSLPVNSETGEYRTIPDSDIQNYNSVEYRYDAKTRATSVELFNTRPWIQFEITKQADKEFVQIDGKDTIIDIKPEVVNYCEFQLYEVPEGTTEINFGQLSDYRLVGTYESGTMLDGNGNRIPGKFRTDILTPGRIYILKESISAPGYDVQQGYEYTVFHQEGETVAVQNMTAPDDYQDVSYSTGGITYATVNNTKNTGSGGNGSIYLSNIKLNKWLQDKNGKYSLLNGAVFSLYQADRDGRIVYSNNTPILFDTLKTGLDNATGEAAEEGQAMSKYINLAPLNNGQTDSRSWIDELIHKYEIEEEKASELVYWSDSEGNPLDPNEEPEGEDKYRAVRFVLKEISAPNNVIMDETEYPVTIVIKNGTASDTPDINDHFYWTSEDSDGKVRLVNKKVEKYSVTVNNYGYIPIYSEAGIETDRELQGRVSGKFTLYRKFINEKGEVVEQSVENGKKFEFGSENNRYGQYIFPEGLDFGTYILVQDSGAKQKTTEENSGEYVPLYDGKDGDGKGNKAFRLEFTVTGPTTVDLFNPAKPVLRIEKKAAGSTGMDGMLGDIKFTLNNNSSLTITTDEHGKGVSETLDSGIYQITGEDASKNEFLSDKYLDRIITDKKQYALGFKKILTESSTVSTERYGLGMEGDIEYLPYQHSGIEITDQLKASLAIEKVNDAGATVRGAVFALYYKPFTGISGTYQMDDEYAPAAESFNENDRVKDDITLNGDGKATVTGLNPGWYRIKETTVPDLYSGSEDRVIAVKGALGGQNSTLETSVRIVNKRFVPLTIKKYLDYGNIDIDKIPEEERPGKAQIKFELYRKTTTSAGNTEYTQVKMYDTNNENNKKQGFDTVELKPDIKESNTNKYYSEIKVWVPQLKPDESYVLREIGAETETWILQGATRVDEEGKHYYEYNLTNEFFTQYPSVETSNTVQLTNKYNKTQLHIEKYDKNSTDRKLSGARFGVYKASTPLSGDTIETIKNADRTDRTQLDSILVNAGLTKAGEDVTSQDGICDFILPADSYYYYMELEAPDKYVLDKGIYPLRQENENVIKVLPGERVGLSLANEAGIDVILKKFDNIENSTNKEPLNGAKFTLYQKVGAGNWKIWAEAVTAEKEVKSDNGETSSEKGTIVFLGVQLGKDIQYALVEKPFSSTSEYYQYELDSVKLMLGTGQTLEETDVEGQKGFLLPTDLSAGMSYRFEAYNRPTGKLTIKKITVDGNDEGVDTTPTAYFEIFKADDDGNPTGSALNILPNGGKTEDVFDKNGKLVTGYTALDVALVPGTYVIQEKQAESGGSLVKDDSRVEWQKTVRVERDGTVSEKYSDGWTTAEWNEVTKKYVLTYKNLQPSWSLGIKKNVETVNGVKGGMLESLLNTEKQNIIYKIGFTDAELFAGSVIKTGKPVNTLPLDSFIVTDEGLSMKSKTETSLEAFDEINDSYAIKSITIGEASYRTTHMTALSGETETFTPQIKAKITLIPFEGDPVYKEVAAGESYSVPDGEKYKSFTISYYDEKLKEKTGYALGEDFNPGDITVSVDIFEQKKTDEDTGAYLNAVSEVLNQASVDTTFHRWLDDGTKSAEETKFSVFVTSDLASQPLGEALRDSASVMVKEPEVPIIKVNKSVTPEGMWQKETEPVYTLSLKNVRSTGETELPMTSPVLIDRLPDGLEVKADGMGTSQDPVTYEITAPDGVIAQVPYRKSDSSGGRYLVIPFSGKLETGEEITVKFKAVINPNSISYSDVIVNKLFVTSADKIENNRFDGNKYAASFKITDGDGTVSYWPNQQTDAKLEEAIGETYPEYGYATAEVRNRIPTSTDDITVLKGVKGSKDREFIYREDVAGSTENKGEVYYHLIVSNTAKDRTLTELRIADVLPYHENNAGDTGINGKERYSAWNLTGKQVTGVWLRNAMTGEKELLDEEQYTVYYKKDRNINGVMNKLEYREDFSDWQTAQNGNIEGAQMIALDIHDVTVGSRENILVEYSTVTDDYSDRMSEVSFKYAVNNFTTGYRYQSAAGTADVQFGSVKTSNLVNVTLEPESVKVGGRLWVDDNHDGIQNEDKVQTELDTDFSAFFEQLLKDMKFNARLNISKGKEVSDSKNMMLDENGRFLFTDLSPASPYDENGLYKDDKLVVSALMTYSPANYQLIITSGGSEETLLNNYGISRIELTSHYSAAPEEMQEPNRSRKPSELYGNGTEEGNRWFETKDSNFTGNIRDARSEQFFLWAVDQNQPEAINFDNSKDIGIILYRNLIIKKMSENGEPLTGAEFMVYGPFGYGESAKKAAAEELGSPLGKYVTNENGTVVISDLDYRQEYVIVETKVPENYGTEGAMAEAGAVKLESLKTSEGQNAWILPYASAGNSYSQVKVTNESAKGELSFRKTDDADGSDLEGAVFELVRKEGYSNTEKSFAAFAEALSNKTAAEQAVMGIKEVKVNKNELETIDRIRFTTIGKTVSLTGVPYGNYELKEVDAPDYYDDVTAVYQVSINGGEESGILKVNGKKVSDNTITNHRADYMIGWEKTDGRGHAISGVTFTVEAGEYKNGMFHLFDRFAENEKSFTASTDENGRITFETVYGDYRITEIPLNGYEAIDPVIIRISPAGEISILSGAVSDETRSHVEIINSVAGSGTGSVLNFRFVNVIKKGTLTVEKVDAEDHGEKLVGAEFKLTGNSMLPGEWEAYAANPGSIAARGIELLPAAEGDTATVRFKVIGTERTLGRGSDGTGYLTGLPYGTYTLEETKAPEGYVLGTSPWKSQFTISEKKRDVEFTTATLFNKTEGAVTNEPVKVIVTKVNAVYADTKLAGAEFILKAADGTFVKLTSGSFDGYTSEETEAGRFTTDSEGHFTVKRLPVGTYTLIEKKAPNGYYVNENIPSFTLDGIHSIEITVQDKKISGSNGSDDGGSEGGRTPGGNTPTTVTIIPDGVPLADVPEQEDLILIDDGEVPLAGLPKTGDHRGNAGKVLMLLSGLMAALYMSLEKKRKEDE